MLRAAMTGTRLEYVVKKLEGTLEREQVIYKKGEGLVRRKAKQSAGYMVYFPRGHVLRMTEAQLKHYRLNRRPKIVNLQGINDPNSPLGKLMNAQDKDARSDAYADLEKMVIQLATVKTGQVLLPEQLVVKTAEA